MDDNAILDLFFARDQRAIEALDNKYGGSCRRLSRNILRDPRDAEECVNDAYLGTWNAIPPARPAPLAAFVYRIVRNLSLKRHRDNTAQKRDGRYDAALSELGDSFPAAETPQSLLETRELARLLEQFLDGLSRENRVLFLRRYWFADSYAEIAARMGLSEKAVSSRLTRLRKQLRRFLTEKGALA